MTYFEQLTGLPEYNLYPEIQKMSLDWGKSNQICINSPIANNSNHLIGTGSLKYDWDNRKQIMEPGGTIRWEVPDRAVQYHEKDFVYLNERFHNTLLGEIYYELKERYSLGRLRLMRSEPKTCLSWHTDSSPRIHYPVKTQEGCLMVIEDEVKHLPANTWWMTDTTMSHTAMNASKETRIHLVAVAND